MKTEAASVCSLLHVFRVKQRRGLIKQLRCHPPIPRRVSKIFCNYLGRDALCILRHTAVRDSLFVILYLFKAFTILNCKFNISRWDQRALICPELISSQSMKLIVKPGIGWKMRHETNKPPLLSTRYSTKVRIGKKVKFGLQLEFWWKFD